MAITIGLYMAERDKVSGFRLPQGTLDKLDDMIAMGIIKNRTDGIINAVGSYHADKHYQRQREPFLYYLNRIVEHKETVNSLKRPDSVFPVRLYHGDGGGGALIDRISPTHVNIRMRFGDYGNTEIVIDIRQKTIIEEEEDDKYPDLF